MALFFKLEGNLLEVKQEIYSFFDTEVSYVTYDIKNWLVTDHHKQGEIPKRPMSESSINWVKKYYLGKVGL